MLLSIATLAMIARYLGVEDYGKFSLIFVILSFFIILTDLGINDIVVRELSKDRSRIPRIMYDLYLLKFLLGLGAIGLSILFIFIFNYSIEIRSLLAWASLSLLFTSWGSIGTILFRVNLCMERSAIANIAKDIALLFSVYGVIFFKGHLLHLIWASLFAHSVNFGFNLFLMRDVMRGSLTPRDLTLWRGVIRSAFPLGLAYLAVTLYAGIDTVLLDRMVGEKAVGYYNAAYKFIYQAIVLPIAFVNSLFPFMSEYWHHDQEKLKILFQKAYDSMVLIAIPFGVAITITAPKLILLIYGDQYAPSILSLQILIWAVVLMFQTIIFGYMMVALDQQRKSLVVDLCALGLNIGLNLILIPSMSFIGASITTVITELFVFIPTIYIIQKRLQFTLSFAMVPKSSFIGILCALLLIISNSLHLFIQLAIGIGGYAFLIYLFKLVPKEDLQLLWQRARSGRTFSK